jgi:hypothetical protein
MKLSRLLIGLISFLWVLVFIGTLLIRYPGAKKQTYDEEKNTQGIKNSETTEEHNRRGQQIRLEKKNKEERRKK